MLDRIQFFDCTAMPVVRRGMETVYRYRAMHIIHWMVQKLDGMDLFENPHNKTPAFIMAPEPFREVDHSEQQNVTTIDLTAADYEDLYNVDESILPQAAIERAHLDVYDSSGPEQEQIPYRLTSSAYDVSSEAYHR